MNNHKAESAGDQVQHNFSRFRSYDLDFSPLEKINKTTW